jgi:hypothetical protein
MAPQDNNPVTRLRQLKTAMRVSAACLSEARANASTDTTPKSPLGVTMAALRRLERRGLADLPGLCARYPTLRKLLTPDLLQHAPHLCLARLRDHAVQLAREEVQDSSSSCTTTCPAWTTRPAPGDGRKSSCSLRRLPRGDPRPSQQS